jgi:hypothetical protein
VASGRADLFLRRAAERRVWAALLRPQEVLGVDKAVERHEGEEAAHDDGERGDQHDEPGEGRAEPVGDPLPLWMETGPMVAAERALGQYPRGARRKGTRSQSQQE